MLKRSEGRHAHRKQLTLSFVFLPRWCLRWNSSFPYRFLSKSLWLLAGFKHWGYHKCRIRKFRLQTRSLFVVRQGIGSFRFVSLRFRKCLLLKTRLTGQRPIIGRHIVCSIWWIFMVRFGWLRCLLAVINKFRKCVKVGLRYSDDMANIRSQMMLWTRRYRRTLHQHSSQLRFCCS